MDKLTWFETCAGLALSIGAGYALERHEYAAMLVCGLASIRMYVAGLVRELRTT